MRRRILNSILDLTGSHLNGHLDWKHNINTDHLALHQQVYGRLQTHELIILVFVNLQI